MKANNTGWSVVNGKDMRYAKVERHNNGVVGNCMDIVNLCASIEDIACTVCAKAKSEKRQAVFVNDEVGEMLATFAEMLSEAVEALPYIDSVTCAAVVGVEEVKYMNEKTYDTESHYPTKTACSSIYGTCAK